MLIRSSHAADSALIVGAVAAIAIAVDKVPWRRLWPPPSLPDRLAKVDSDEIIIDNDLYDAPDFDWHDLNPLLKMNSARLPYFLSKFSEATHRAGRDPGDPGDLSFADVGCGVGFVTEELARSGFRIIGVDVLPLSIERAKKHASSSDLPHLDYVVGSAYSLPFESSSLTGVVSSDVLEHLDDLRSCFSEIARVLKPGGVFVFDTINRTSFSYFVCYLLPQPILRILPPNAHAWQLFISPAEVRRGLEEVGLAVGEEDNIRGMMPTLTIPSPGNWGTKWAWLGPWRQTAIVKGSYAWYAWKPL